MKNGKRYFGVEFKETPICLPIYFTTPSSSILEMFLAGYLRDKKRDKSLIKMTIKNLREFRASEAEALCISMPTQHTDG